MPSTTKIDLFVIGAMKSATTGMCDWLAVQPGVAMSVPKEPSVFVSDASVTDWSPKLGSLFSGALAGAVRVDGSTDYAKFPAISGVPARVHAHNLDARIVYLMRHPIERTISQYRFEWLLGAKKLPFEQALEQNTQLVDNSRYAHQLRPWLEHFDPSRIHLAFAESFFDDPAREVGRVLDFAAVHTPGVQPPASDHSNESAQLVRRSEVLRRLRHSAVGESLRPLVPQRLTRAYQRRMQERATPEVSERAVSGMTNAFDRDLEQLQRLTGGPPLSCATWHDVTTTWTPSLHHT